MMLSINKLNGALWAFAATTTLFGFISAQVVGSKDLFRCRQSCYQKFVQDWHHCMDFEDCKNCWNNCDQQLGPFQLNINSALRQGSLVITDIGWDQAITNASKQCLVTWEVSGGGLMGNLLTDSSSVELSLWLDTVYHVQVTCKHKETGGMRRSYKLIVDTHKLSDDSMATGLQAIAMDSVPKLALNNIYSDANSAETDSRLRILKDSSKDFLSPYNPNAAKEITTTTETVIKQRKESDRSFESIEPLIRREAQDFLTQSIVFAIAGSVILFFVLLLVYALTRPVPKELPSSASSSFSTDKQALIHTEMLPSQTPLARQQQQPSLSLADSRTLHV